MKRYLLCILLLLFGCQSSEKKFLTGCDLLREQAQFPVWSYRSFNELSQLFSTEEQSEIHKGCYITSSLLDATRILLIESENPQRFIQSLSNIDINHKETYHWLKSEENSFVDHSDIIIRSNHILWVVSRNHEKVVSLFNQLFP